uniref:Uncharacterized protein n=1 Tax=Anguilla anguilla TaxID=7936 RepID=A0A0E9PPR3_ANGAN
MIHNAVLFNLTYYQLISITYQYTE